ncbi:MAG: hypothetical protein JM58_16280 [Peptococcaceae bacterium BICA1-8]|nr:MAG: hypothetical protein JM58_16280 [Peptococcaceae bacterium BICA1-8]
MREEYFQVRGRIINGLGKADEVSEEAKRLNVNRVVVVTEKAIQEAGVIENILKSLKNGNIEYIVYNGVHSDPSVKIMDEIARLVKESGAQGLIGVGGGSSLDATKGAAIVCTNGGSIRDYIGENKFKIAPLPLIAIPTTAGTGSEVTWHISVNDTERKLKVTVRSFLCVPEVAILDPNLMVTVPAKVAAFTGMDAFTHAFESYISTKGSWIMTETLALKAMELIAINLRVFVANRQNVEAGENMLIASMMGGMCLSHARTGIIHQMARPLGALFHVPHGLANSMLLPYAMEFSVFANPGKFANVARVMGIKVDGLSEMEAAKATIIAVKELCNDIGLPNKLRDVGVKEELLSQLAEDAMQGRDLFDNPRQGTVEDLIKIYRSAY